MAKCPRCGSGNISCTNWMEIIGSNIAGGVASSVFGLINPSMMTPVQLKVSRNIAPNKEYVCNSCGNKWSQGRAHI